ncbi:non-ribosomal peptide synthetase [Bacillus glycinifermentans]|uniref:non-ribosomal peptide synthetase n=2 Tax=Bacillus glycinifermentans TaxID=1664069 RepID=UPI0022E1B638|nr:non-ribosomal peptide synthetase [Bacillus glycinifermentans]
MPIDWSKYGVIEEHPNERVPERIEPVPLQDVYALSSAQKRMYVLQQLDLTSTAYNMPRIFIIEGMLEHGRLEKAFSDLISRHESLRTRFFLKGGAPVQQVLQDVPFTVSFTNGTEGEAEHWAQSFIQPFDLHEAPLLRVKVMSLSDERHLLAIDLHHIIADGVTVNLLIRELLALYQEKELAPLPFQYKDFAVWQNARMKNEAYAKQEEYWLELLADELPVLELPLDKPHPAVQSFAGDSVETAADLKLKRKLELLARENGATLYMVLLAAYQTLLARYSGQDDIVVGSPIAGRPHADLEMVAGMFVNTLAMRGYPQIDKTFRIFLKEIRETVLEAFEHQEVQFEGIVEKLGIPRDVNRNPVFDTMFALQHKEEEPVQDSLTFRSYEVKHMAAKFDILLQAEEQSDGLRFIWEYRTALFERETVERFADHWLQLLRQITDDPDMRLGEIDLLSDSEKQQLLVTCNGTKADYPKDKTVHQLFEEQVKRTPDHIAAVFEDRKLTYQELNSRANQLARMLRRAGVKAEQPVALITERSLEMIVGIFAILKAGGAYVPIDPEYPEDRIRYMLEDSGTQMILASKAAQLPSTDSKTVFLIDDAAAAQYDSSNMEHAAAPEQLAYIMYTSGTTGRPKGVMVEHRNIVHLTTNRAYIPFAEIGRLAQTGAVSFDASVFEVFGTLLNGGTVYPVSKEILLDSTRMNLFLKNNGIMTMWLTSPLFNRHAQENSAMFAGLRHLIVGGDVLSVKHIHKVKRSYPELVLWNGYGPTENTTFSTCYQIQEESEIIPIGRPISHSSAYIVNSKGRLQPVGVPGELCLGGAGLARGYVNQPELTEEMFVSNPHAPGERMYKTGDVARWLPDGNIEYLGRFDQQVKVRGHRVELGEIESRLLEHECIQAAAVTVRDNGAGDKELCAYYVAMQAVKAEQLHHHVAAVLPSYMVPDFFTEIPSLPLTANGKLDRQALPEPDRATAADSYVEPATKTEAQLAGIWQEILGVERVGATDHFFKLGGHSLKAMSLISRIHQDMESDMRLREVFSHPTVRELASWIDRNGRTSRYARIEPAPQQEEYPVSSAQKRMYVLQQLDPKATAYNMPAFIMLEGELDYNRLEQAFRKLIQRHESLRTQFVLREGIPVQQVLTDVPFMMAYESETEKKARVWAQSFVQPFDLGKAPLLRAGVMPVSDKQNVLAIDMHHIIADGVTVNLLVNELCMMYEGADLEPLSIHYKDFAVWQNARIQSGDYATQEAYWREQLGGELPVLQLPADKPRPAMQSFAGDVVEATAGPELKRKLEQAAQESDTTLYIVLLAAYQTLLSRYSGQDDIIVGSPVAGRPHTDLEKIAGMFVNTLALRGNPAGNKTFRTFTKEMKETVLSAFENQDVQFEALVDMLGVRRDVNRNPVFDAMFALQNTDNPELTLDGLTLRPYEQQHTMAKFDVSLLAKENGDTLQFTWEYSTELFERETVERWTGHWLQLLGQITDNPDIRLGEIDVLTKAEKDQLLFSFNDTKAEYPRDKTIHQLFEEQTERTPRHTAVLYEGGQMTYQELNARANRLARILRNKGVKPDHIVGLMVRRSVEMLVGILGILKAGGAYLPIDPDYPEERIRFMLEDSQTRLLLRQPDGKAPISFNGKRIILDETEELSGIEPNLPPAAKANDLAYLIYTSGSTGKPKGVMVEHHSVINRLHWMQKCYPLRAHDVILQKTQFSFDVSVWELLWWGEVGAKVCLLPPGGEKDPKVLFQTIAQHGVTTIHFVPSMLSAFLDALEDENRVEQIRSVRRVFASGEALPAALVERFQRLVSRKIGADLINMYGPTEATVEVSHYKCSKTEAVTTVPIGKPIDNLQLSIVSPYQAMQPIGVAGELCISGAGLARGYLNRPELTAEKFVNHPFMTDVRMYKTGDLARWLPDGNIEYLGRADQQVKIRGYRVELGEIEHRLLEHKAVKEAVVTAQEDANGDKALSAYFVAKQPLAAEELRVHVASELPSYMVPAFFTSLPSMPLTANGKLNRKALPEPDRVSARPEYVKPATETEERLALLWQKVLGLKRAGAADHFFESGGHSLKAMTLVSRIHRELGADIHLRDIFRHPTVRELAKWIETNQNTSSHASIEPAPQQETYAVSSAQKRMYVLQQLDPHATAYNMPAVLVLEGDLDRKRLENAFQCLIERHESLRTRFILADGEPVQQVMKKAPLAVAYAGGTEEEAEQWAQSFVQPFDLRTAPLLRVGVMTISAVRHLLAIDMHHIIADGVTISNFINEFSRLYDGAVLDPLKIQYKDFAVWQNARMESEAYRKKEGYWIEQLGGELPLLQLPADKPRPPVQSFSGDVLTVTVEGEQKLKLERLARENGATLYMVLLAAYQTLLSHYTRQDDIIVGSPISGRLHADLENVAGMFANTLALRGYPKGEKTFKRFLKEIRETALEAFEHQEVPFEVLIEKLGVHRDINRNPIFDAMFALQNMENAELKMDGLTLCPYELKYKTAKFDLTMHAEEKGEELQFTWEYSTALFERETVERWAGHWLRLLKQVTENPDVRLGDIDLLTETEKDQLFKTFNSTKADYPENKTIQQLFEEQAERTPDHIAIAFKDRTLTYRELNKRANRLAHALRRRGVQPNDVIGLMMERSPDMIIGILGILKSGAAFVPVDPDYPAQRIRLMIEDSSASIFVAQSHLAERLPSAVTMIEADSSAMRNESEDNPAAVNEPEHFFYVIYTSGTTGKPKGVMLNHRNFVNLIHFQLTKTDVDFSHAVLQYATFNFDASYHEIFSTLLSGGRLQLITKEQRTDVNELLGIIEDNRIQVLFLPPSFLKFVFQNKDYAERFPACVRHIACAGEQLVVTAEMKKALCEKQITLHNYYGPSETHVVTTLTMKPGDLIDDFPAIGKPISNTRIYLLNDSKKPVPIGVDGELYIAGDSVGPGYMNQAQLTAEKFEADPFHSGGSMYQTGDLARWLPDGNIKYIGRIDHQIKIRGYRIELDEIEQRLLAHEAVKEAAVIVRADAAGDKTLCAYYTAKLPVGTDELRGHLASALPAYMLPSFLTELERMPVTANGKLNRKALPEPKHLAGATYVEPSTATEAQLAVLWQETLGLDRVGADDHFFELGGHSLKAMNLVARIHQELDTEVPLRELFRHPTVRELAAWIEANGSASPYAAIQPAPRNIKRKGD